MSNLVAAYSPLAELIQLHTIFAYSQYIALRADVFSLATGGVACLAAYASAILVVKLGLGLLPAVLFGALLGALAGLLLSIPLGRLRGVYQAIATLAFVQIILSLALWAEPLTGGAMGMNNLPKLAGVPVLLLAAAMVFASVWALSTTSIGRIFDIIRQEEIVAVSLGINVAAFQRLAFVLSGTLAGIGGRLTALRIIRSYRMISGFRSSSLP